MRTRRDVLASIPVATLLAGCAAEAPLSSDSVTEGPSDGPPDLGSTMDVDTSGDGIPDLVLEELGVDPYRPNVFVQVDPVVGVEYEPLLEHARDVFASAPIENPDGSTGIDVHFEVSDPLPFERVHQQPILEADLHRLRFGHPGVRSFAHRNRGHRHVVIDDAFEPGMHGTRFVQAVPPHHSAALSNVLVAQLSGAFNPELETELESEYLDSDLSVDEFVERVDWDLLGSHHPKTTPSTRYYEEKYAHLDEDHEVETLSSVPDAEDPEQDTSGDGIPDQLIRDNPLFEGASPLRRSMFFEIQYTPGVTREDVETHMDRVETFFADAPIRNPDGTMGMDIHYTIEGELDEFGHSVSESDLASALFNHFQRRRQGYYYLLFVDHFEGLAGRIIDGEALGTELRSSTLLHEIGHAIGLYGGLVGIDDHQRTFEEYPSVMNYNSRPSTFTFAGGDGLDSPNDWGIIDEEMDEWAPAITRVDDW